MILNPAVDCATMGNTLAVPACIFCGVRNDPVGAGMGLFWLALVGYCCYLSGRKLLRRLRSFWSR
jgi:hypothetical protein